MTKVTEKWPYFSQSQKIGHVNRGGGNSGLSSLQKRWCQTLENSGAKSKIMKSTVDSPKNQILMNNIIGFKGF